MLQQTKTTTLSISRNPEASKILNKIRTLFLSFEDEKENKQEILESKEEEQK